MKVGKGIYNILSQSKDVQSNCPFKTTDYVSCSTELVTNGDFSTDSDWTTSGSGGSTVTTNTGKAVIDVVGGGFAQCEPSITYT